MRYACTRVLLTKSEKLAGRILRVLAEHPASTTDALRRWLPAQAHGNSRRAIYKALGQLQADGVILKSGHLYSLRLGWLMDLEAWVQQAHRRQAESLAPVESAAAGALRLLVAARIGRTRLIDNIAV